MPRLSDPDRYRNASDRQILKKAKEVVDLEVLRSTVFDPDAEAKLARFDEGELLLGRVLGRGGFCIVHEISAIKLKPINEEEKSLEANGWFRKNGKTNSTTLSADQMVLSARTNLARQVWSKKGGKLVLKKVAEQHLDHDRVTYLKGTIDLAMELKFLQSLDHPHILKVKGLSSTGPFDRPGFFLVVDQLPEILSKRLTRWMHAVRATKGLTGRMTGGKRKKVGLLVERLLVAYDIAQALDYLHSRKIIYRDLKPDNVGFDDLGSTKLFDFGLAKELLDSERDSNGLYRLTGFTGAVRYMAPEVGLRRPYNQLADVYSWSMVFWYIMALEPPMGMYTPRMIIDRVFEKGYRPAVMDKWPAALGRLMKQCWSSNINDRPDFGRIMGILYREVHTIDPTAASIMGH